MRYTLIEKAPSYIIIDKPSGLLVHSTPKKEENEETLVDQLLEDFPEINKVGNNPIRPGIVHRIDRLVSGLMVVATDQKSFENLKKQFKNRTINKHYTALCYGKIEADEGIIDLPIKRSRKGNRMAAQPKTNKGELNTDARTAITEFTVIKRYINFTLLKVRLKTGRNHQIRCHLAAYGNPLMGDDLYGNNKTKAKNKKFDLNRIFLTATELEFTDLNNSLKSYKIDLPEELEKFLKEKVK